MSEQKKPDQAKTPRASESGDVPKKPYLKPAFRREQVFETMALACGKVKTTQASCRVNRKNS
jgi:hypothetical protein